MVAKVIELPPPLDNFLEKHLHKFLSPADLPTKVKTTNKPYIATAGMNSHAEQAD